MANQQLIDHLALQVSDYPRDGGPRPEGMLILQRGKKRIPLDKGVPKWSKGTSIPTEVAEILLGIQFDKKKVVASCFDAAEAVTRHFGWELTWREDFKLGGYLLSCLTKAEYYGMYNMLKSNFKFEYALSARKKAVRDYPESDPYTSDVPFPPWTGAVDENGKALVKPSKDQLKRTVWKPSDDEFKVNDTVGDPPDYIVRKLVRHYKEYPEIYGKPTKAQVIARWKKEGGLGWRLGVSRWVLGVNKLETNAYRINQKLLEVVNTVVDTLTEEYKATSLSLKDQLEVLKQERKQRKKGEVWSRLALEDRTIDYLDSLWLKQKKQDSLREKQGKKVLPDKDKNRFLRYDQKKIRGEYWSRWYECTNAIQATDTKFKELKRTLKHCNERLVDEPFYQRAFLDHRGRIYLSRSIVNYQSGDLQRGLVDFAEGKKVRKADMKYLYLHLANLAGIKGDADTRGTYALIRRKDWMKWGKNPVKYYANWSDLAGDDKWQFIRACIELAELDKNPNHKSSLIAEIDQSTSCLQHIALILGDRDLANRVNLGPDYEDIYQEIADKISDLNGLNDSHRRKVVKMALVPWTYGGNEWTASDSYHKSDMPYLKDMTASERFNLARTVINRIEAELPSAVGFRDEYQDTIDLRWEHTTERNAIWRTSSGFTVYVYRQKTDERRVYIWHEGKGKGADRDETVKVTAYEPNSTPNKAKIKTAHPPNYVHSIDAAVMHLVLAYTPKDQSCVSVHDALGTHIRDVKDAEDRFRSAFHWVYSKAHPAVMAQGFLEPLPPGQADPTEYHYPDGTPFIDAEFLAEVAKAPHMTG